MREINTVRIGHFTVTYLPGEAEAYGECYAVDGERFYVRFTRWGEADVLRGVDAGAVRARRLLLAPLSSRPPADAYEAAAAGARILFGRRRWAAHRDMVARARAWEADTAVLREERK